MDDFIIPGKPEKKGGVRQIVDVSGSEAPIIKLGEGDLLIVGETGLHFLVPGPYIVLPLERWTTTLRRSIEVTQRETELDSRQVRRAQHRAITQDRNN